MVIILLLCTLLSMPAYILFWSGNVINNPDRKGDNNFDLNSSLATISLANLGEKSQMVLEIPLSNPNKTQHSLDLFCDQASIGPIDFQKYGVALPFPDWSYDEDYIYETWCGIPIPESNLDIWNNTCLGAVSC